MRHSVKKGIKAMEHVSILILKIYLKHTLSKHFIRYLLRFFFLLIETSAAVAYPLKSSTCCVFRDASLHTPVVMCVDLHYCHLPVSFDQSGHSPRTSLINKTFLSLQTLETFVCENTRRPAVSEIHKPPCLAPTIIPRSLG